jgi:hypothetical protein
MATTSSQALELCDRLRQVLVNDTSAGVVNLLDQVIHFLELQINHGNDFFDEEGFSSKMALD